jgi:Rrf2 family nitric oxide-sensitive transcriptional repressor
MQLNLQTDYALRVLMALAAGDRQSSVEEIARQYGISRNHLANVAQKLHGEGFITTFRGRGGGMRLARPVEQIVVGDVVRRFENLDSFVGCFAGGSGCVVNGSCGLKPALGGALAAFLDHLDGYRLSDLVPDRQTFLERLLAEPAVA